MVMSEVSPLVNRSNFQKPAPSPVRGWPWQESPFASRSPTWPWQRRAAVPTPKASGRLRECKGRWSWRMVSRRQQKGPPEGQRTRTKRRLQEASLKIIPIPKPAAAPLIPQPGQLPASPPWVQLLGVSANEQAFWLGWGWSLHSLFSQ